MRALSLAMALLLASASAYAGEEPIDHPTQTERPKVYVQLIVKACPRDPADIEPCVAAATANAGLPYRMCPKATNHGKIYDHEKSMSRAERHAYYARIGCIDVPVPPEVLMGGDGVTPKDLTLRECMGKRGYLSAMQYLEQNASIEQKAVGEWVCIEQPFPVAGVAAQ